MHLDHGSITFLSRQIMKPDGSREFGAIESHVSRTAKVGDLAKLGVEPSRSASRVVLLARNRENALKMLIPSRDNLPLKPKTQNRPTRDEARWADWE